MRPDAFSGSSPRSRPDAPRFEKDDRLDRVGVDAAPRDRFVDQVAARRPFSSTQHPARTLLKEHVTQTERRSPLVLLGPTRLVLERVGPGDLRRQLECDFGLRCVVTTCEEQRRSTSAAAITAAITAMKIPTAPSFIWTAG